MDLINDTRQTKWEMGKTAPIANYRLMGKQLFYPDAIK